MLVPVGCAVPDQETVTWSSPKGARIVFRRVRCSTLHKAFG